MSATAVARSHHWGAWSGGALLMGSALIAVKSLAILITGDEPQLIFEISPFFLGVGMLLVAPALSLEGPRRRAVPALALTSLVAGAVAGVTELTGEVFGPAIAVATLSAIVAAVVSGWRPAGDPRKRALLLVGIAVVPALVIGGILSEFNERLLEVGLLAYAAAWALAGFRMLGRG